MSSYWHGTLLDENLVCINVSLLGNRISCFEAINRMRKISTYKFLISASLDTLFPSDSVFDGVFTQMKIISESLTL